MGGGGGGGLGEEYGLTGRDGGGNGFEFVGGEGLNGCCCGGTMGGD